MLYNSFGGEIGEIILGCMLFFVLGGVVCIMRVKSRGHEWLWMEGRVESSLG